MSHFTMELNVKDIFGSTAFVPPVTGEMGSPETIKNKALPSFSHMAGTEASSSLPQTPPDFGNLLTAF